MTGHLSFHPADHEPGAREARTVRFVDRYLSGLDYVYAQPLGHGAVPLEEKQAEAWRRRSGSTVPRC